MDLPATGALYTGGSLFILRRFEPIRVLKSIDREKMTNLWLAPAMMNMLFQEPSFEDYDISSVSFIIDGGEKMPLSLIRQIINRKDSQYVVCPCRQPDGDSLGGYFFGQRYDG